ncbi:MAG: type II toxin-antitoxin system antitoxin SocA domain-containing protein [Legionellales bacterium]|jgi:transcriptional regulator with XRE-family HTH domain
MLAAFIKQLREKHQMTQEQVAEQLGMVRQTYMQLERAERALTVPEAEKLAQLFDMSLDDFLNQRQTEVLVNVQKMKIPQKDKAIIRVSVPQQQKDKFKQILLYILKKVGGKPNVGMTVLYKLLYFIDFDYYEKYEEQIMGLLYFKNHYGPTPILFENLIKEMLENNEIELIKSKFYKHEQKKYLINPEVEPDLSILNGQEMEHIDWELKRLSDLNATVLSELSHKDVPWISAQTGKSIDYEAVFYRTADTSVRSYND